MKPADFCFDRTPTDFPSAMLDENDALWATAQAGARIRKLQIKTETRAHVYPTQAHVNSNMSKNRGTNKHFLVTINQLQHVIIYFVTLQVHLRLQSKWHCGK